MVSLREVVERHFDELVPCFFARSPALPSANWVAGQALVSHSTADGCYLYTEGNGYYQLVMQERGGCIPDPNIQNNRDYAIDRMTMLLDRVIKRENVRECNYASGRAYEIDDQMTTVWDRYVQLVLQEMAEPA